MLNFHSNDKDNNLIKVEHLANALKPLIEQQETLKPSIKPIADALKEFSLKTKVDVSGFEGMYRLAYDFAEKFDRLRDSARSSIITLLEYGWYIDEELTFIQMDELSKTCHKDIASVEEFLCNHYESELGRIEDFIFERYPHRAAIISAAMKAHRNEDYGLSIPIMLIQVDGICKEKTNRYFFMRPKGVKKPETSLYVDVAIEDIPVESIRYAMLIPLMRLSPIHKNQNERDEEFDHLNRHLIIHGDSYNYNTKVNSYKAISLLNYIIYALEGLSGENP